MISFERHSRVFSRQALFSACLLLLPCAARASCAHWDISGEWVAVQTNDAKPVLTLQQTGAVIQGSGHWAYTVSYNTFPAKGDDYVEANASVDGTINGDSVEFNAYWSNDSIGIYSGRIGPQGRIEGVTYDKRNPQTRADWYSSRTMPCLDAAADPAGASPAPIALGRVQKPSHSLAKEHIDKTFAGSRDSAARGITPGIPPIQRTSRGRVVDVLSNRIPPATEKADPVRGVPPVPAPNDLLVGRMRFSQAGGSVEQLHLGQPVAIECSYSVNETPNPFWHIRPWQGSIEIGSNPAQSLPFEGRADAGQHSALVTWLPTAAGPVSMTCELNERFADAEADHDNNRWTQTVIVQPAEEPTAP